MTTKKYRLHLMFGRASSHPADWSLEKARIYIIGRDHAANIRLGDASVSLRHAVLETTDLTVWTLKDLRSSNGTFLDERRVGERPVQLGTAGELRLGTLRGTYQLVELEAEDAARAEGWRSTPDVGGWTEQVAQVPGPTAVFELEEGQGKGETQPTDRRPQTRSVLQVVKDLESRLETPVLEGDQLRQKLATLERAISTDREPQLVRQELERSRQTAETAQAECRRLHGEVTRLKAENAALRNQLEEAQNMASDQQHAYVFSPAIRELFVQSLETLDHFGLSLGSVLAETRGEEGRALRERLMDVSAGLLDLRSLLEAGQERLGR